MSKMKAAIVLAAAGLLASAGTASAQRPPNTFALWKIDPVADFQTKILSVRELVVRVPMLPATLYYLEEDYVQDNGRPAAPAGTPLVALNTGNLACAIFPPRLTGLTGFFAGDTERNLCFQDRQNDGVFDAYVYRQDNPHGFYNMHTRLAPTKRGTGGRYRRGDPATMANPLTWNVNFQGGNERRKSCVFSTLFGVPSFDPQSPDPNYRFGKNLSVDVSTGSGRLEFRGAVFNVRMLDAKRVEVSLESNFDGKPFPIE